MCALPGTDQLKPWVSYVVLGVFTFLTGLGFGFHYAPDKTVTVDHSEEVTALKQKVASLLEEITTLKTNTRTVVVYSPTTGKPLSKTTETHTDKTVEAKTDLRISTDVASAKLLDHSVTTESTLPHWSLSAMAAFDFASRTPAYGAQLEYQFKLPFIFKAGSVGVFGLVGPVVRMGGVIGGVKW